ncbi:xylulokinase [soil metagenome]
MGLDLGTSSIKATAVDDTGEVLGGARRTYPTHRPEHAAAEQDPQDWWTALDEVLGELAARFSPGCWRGIGLSAMLPTLVQFDSAGNVTGPAVTWEDARAEPQAQQLCAAVGDSRIYQVTGQRVDGRYLAPMHTRLRELGHGGAIVAGAKDALFERLTGELHTDPSTAAGFGVFDLDADAWDSELVRLGGLPGLPRVSPSSMWRPMLPIWSRRWGLPEGLPVVLGGADSVVGAAGIGATRHGDVAIIAGTSAVVLGISDTSVRDPHRRYLVTPMAGAGWGLEMDVLAVGSAFSGIAELVGFTGPEALLDAAVQVPADDAPVFLPYLTPGEQGALWDPTLTGTLHGLRLGMSPAQVGRALLTGVINELRRCVQVLEDVTATRGPIMLGGGAAGHRQLRQELADATGRQVLVDTTVGDHSAVGAAILAADALGQPVPLRSEFHSITADPDRYRWWAQTAEQHDRIRRALVGER